MKLQEQPVQSRVHIPLNLAFAAIKTNTIAHLKLYIYLKIHCNGIFQGGGNSMGEIAMKLEVSRNSIKNWITLLIQRNWIGYDPRTKWYFVRGFTQVCLIEKVSSKRAALLFVKDFHSFNGFLCALPFAQIYRRNFKRDRGWAVYLQGNTFQPTRNLSLYIPIATEIVAKYLEINLSKAYSIRKSAKKSGYLIIHPNIKKFTSVSKYKIGLMQQYENTFLRKNIFIKNGFAYQRLPDLIYSKIHFTRR